jgi:Ulp1 protease family, C-terminal catalytic domain
MSTFQCSPALHRRDGETCLPTDALERLARTWNKTHPRHKISISQTRKADPHTDIDVGGRAKPKQTRHLRKSKPKPTDLTLWNQLREKMKSHYKCETEFCAVKKIPGLSDKDKRELKGYFKPEKPQKWDKKPTDWLDSYNIEDVMKQYEAAYPFFEFIGPVPIDFDAKDENAWGKCIVNELCRLDLQESAKKGKTKIGVIFNLDPHDEPGSHWVCAFIDLEKGNAYYFDSYGYEPPDEIERLLKRCKDQGCKNIYYNDIRHQRKGSECGMYSLFVIICLLSGKEFTDICKNVIDDDRMNKFRDIVFAEEKPRKGALEEAVKTLCI